MARANHNTQIKGRILCTRGGYPNCNAVVNDKIVPSKWSIETTSGVNRRKPVGWIPPTPYSYDREKVALAYGTSVQRWLGSTSCNFGFRFTGVCGGSYGTHSSTQRFAETLSYNTVWDSTLPMVNRTLIKARLKLKSSDVNLGVAFGERNQTARLLGDTATRLAKSIRALRSGRIRHAMNILGITSSKRQPRGRNVPQKWLELQYGWKPLCSDVFGAVDALTKRPASDWRVTVKAAESIKVEGNKSFGASLPLSIGFCRASGEAGVLTRIDALPENVATITLASLGILNPLEVGWELVPFSFVVDWAWPIGQYLSSLDALLGYNSAGTYCSVSRFMKVKWTETGGDYTGQGWHIENEWKGMKELVRLRRTVSTGVPIPSFPGIKDPRSLGHMANGLALLSQVFGRN